MNMRTFICTKGPQHQRTAKQEGTCMQQAAHAYSHSALKLMTVYLGTRCLSPGSSSAYLLDGRVGLYDAAGSHILDTLKRTQGVPHRQLRLVEGVPLIDFGRGKKGQQSVLLHAAPLELARLLSNAVLNGRQNILLGLPGPPEGRPGRIQLQ